MLINKIDHEMFNLHSLRINQDFFVFHVDIDYKENIFKTELRYNKIYFILEYFRDLKTYHLSCSGDFGVNGVPKSSLVSDSFKSLTSIFDDLSEEIQKNLKTSVFRLLSESLSENYNTKADYSNMTIKVNELSFGIDVDIEKGPPLQLTIQHDKLQDLSIFEAYHVDSIIEEARETCFSFQNPWVV